MKFLMVDDEHELYRVMMADLFSDKQYDVEEVKRVAMPRMIRKLHDLHYSRRLNRFGEVPGKGIWNRWYELHKYPFDPHEKYIVLFMNGSLRNFYNEKYLIEIRNRHPNVKLCLLIFDKSIYYGAKRAINMRECFDYVFSFDDDDCKKYGFERFYNCFSKPANMKRDASKESDAFFIGNAGGRLQKLQEVFKHISKLDQKCRFFITGVAKEDMEEIPNVIYNQGMPFDEEMNYSYNSNCLVEILREGQSGISLRVCEAIAFQKKLLTNNVSLKDEEFYDERFMRVFSSLDEIDADFLGQKIDVEYHCPDVFSPLRICDRIIEMEKYK